MRDMNVAYPGKWAGSKLWKQHWISETSRSWDRRVEGFSESYCYWWFFQGSRACRWAVVQIDNDKEEDPWYATYGTMLAELEAQRTFENAELCAFTMALSELVGLSTIHTDKMGILDGLWRENECFWAKTRLPILWMKTGIID